jgi:uncharacterized membrane protein YoaK (UPF0700 family)
MVDIIGYLTLKLFTAHITGNLVLVAALLVRGGPPKLDQYLAIPTFASAVAAVWLIAKASQKRGRDIGRVLLFIQFALLACVLVMSLIWHPSANPREPVFTITAMSAVSAMASQYCFLILVMPGAPSTAVMTRNLTLVTLALLDKFGNEALTKSSSKPLDETIPVLFGFFVGCTAGAVAVVEFQDWAWSFPVALMAVAATMVPRTAA